jgi:signal transduction histidine kinase/CheY-like chemotaxis protein
MTPSATPIASKVLSQPNEHDAERAQALVRIIIAVVVIAYILLRWAFPFSGELSDRQTLLLVFYYIAAFMLVAVLLFWRIVQHPGHSMPRRVFAMTLDYSSLVFTIIMGGEVMLPLFAVMIWVTVGNGLRYGARYLLIAIGMTMLSMAVITWFTPYLREHPNLVITLVLTALIVPSYAVSLLRRTEEARKAALEANIAKSRFLAQASHDLRQPVHAIGLFIASLRQAGLNGSQRGIVDRIDRSLQGVASLFRSLLDISTLDSGAVTPKPEPVSISSLFVDLAQQNIEGAAWAEVELRFAASQLVVITDRALLATMVQNLISNALKYAPGKPVLVGCRRKAGGVAIVVCDQGPGIEAQHIPHISEEFYRIRKVGDPDTQGVGLGLAIVERLSRMMGLNIQIRSRIGYGTTVMIGGLPLSSGTEAAELASRRADYRMPLKGMRILLIEDDPDVLDATTELLMSWGCEVQPFTAIPVAWKPCDLIIVDFDIGGGVTGADCIAAVRAQVAQRRELDIPAIVMTGHDEVRVSGILNDDRIPILKKPIRPAEMRSSIAAMRLRAKADAA